MTPDTIKAILETEPSKEAKEMAEGLMHASDGYTTRALLSALLQHVSDVAKEIDAYFEMTALGQRHPTRERLQSLILPEPKDRLAEAWDRALEVYDKTHHAVGEPRKAGLAALRETLARHGAKIVFEEEG